MRTVIAHTHNDGKTADEIASAMRKVGHEVILGGALIDDELLVAKHFFERLSNIDVVVFLLSGETSQRNEIVNIVEYFQRAWPDKPSILVNLDNSPQSRGLQRFLQLNGQDLTPEKLGYKIAGELTRIEKQRAVSREAVEKRKETVERTSELYITESLKLLESREQKYQMWSFVCYGLGYLTLLGGLSYALNRGLKDAPDLSDAAHSIYASVLTLTVIGFLAASSRFAFVLGKSFMIESLRNHDRIHAIRFGEFYLKAFGEDPNWDDLKEAFQHWNFDSGSNFKDQSDESIDPQVLKLLAEIVRKVKP